MFKSHTSLIIFFLVDVWGKKRKILILIFVIRNESIYDLGISSICTKHLTASEVRPTMSTPTGHRIIFNHTK